MAGPLLQVTREEGQPWRGSDSVSKRGGQAVMGEDQQRCEPNKGEAKNRARLDSKGNTYAEHDTSQM